MVLVCLSVCFVVCFRKKRTQWYWYVCLYVLLSVLERREHDGIGMFVCMFCCLF